MGGWAVEGGRAGACRGTAYSGLCSAALVCFFPTLGQRKAQRGLLAWVLSLARCNGQAGGQWVVSRGAGGAGGGSAGLECWLQAVVMCGTAL